MFTHKILFKSLSLVSLLSPVLCAMVAPTGLVPSKMCPVMPSSMAWGVRPYISDAVCPIINRTHDDQKMPGIKAIKAWVDTYAKDYGSKTSNLMALNKITNDEKLQMSLATLGFTVTVPRFEGIGDQAMKNFLRSTGLDLDKEWQNVLHNANMSILRIRDTLTTKTLTKEFILQLQGMGQKIKNQFELLAQMAEKEEHTNFYQQMLNWFFKKTLFTPEIEALLVYAQKNNLKLMVRSTGKEDTKECPNAGGNKSIANVPPRRADLLRAISSVLQSYIIDSTTGEPKSFMQRLVCGNNADLFDNFFGAALVQVMIGENGANDSIPVGCVVYTEESEGKTPGITSTQCSFGHAEGVVESSVGIDSCYIDTTGKFHCIIKSKPSRLVPVCNEHNGCTLERMNNPATIHNLPALSEQALSAINIIAKHIQALYDQPMDIELVVDHDTVYLVQARPITDDQKNPHYITSLDTVNAESIIEGTAVCVADASVRHIKNKNELIVAQTLDDALNIFNNPTNEHHHETKAVIVAGYAESTSHAAAEFRGAGIPILIAQNTVQIEQWVEQGLELMLDVQRECVVLALDLPISKGWFSHPLPNKVSIVAATCDVPMKAENFFPDMPLQTLIKYVQEGEVPVAQQALATILFKINEQIEQKARQITCDDCYHKVPAHYALSLLESLRSYIFNVVDQINSHLQLPARDIERLYYINWLEAALLQKESKNIVNSYSFDSVLNNYDMLINFIEQKVNPLIDAGSISRAITQQYNAINIAFKGASVALVEQVQQNWIKFIDALYQQQPQTIEQFENLMMSIEELDILPAWINFACAPLLNDSSTDAIAVFNKLHQEFLALKDILHEINDARQLLEAYDTTQWQYPLHFQAQLKTLKNLIDIFTSNHFIDILSQSQLVKLAIISTLDRFIELFDQSIKQLKGSTHYPQDRVELVTNFKHLLQEYFNLLNVLVNKLPSNALVFHSNWPLMKYMNEIQERLKNLPIGPEQLIATPGFSVANAALGSNTAFERNVPVTGEDNFTLIHQNLLVTLGALTKLSIPVFAKPQSFDLFETMLLTFSSDRGKMWLIGLKLSHDQLVARYNLPLRNHSVLYELVWDLHTQQLFLTIKFVGQRRSRWDAVIGFAQINNEFFDDLKAPLHETTMNGNEVHITYEISNASVTSFENFIRTLMVFANTENTDPLAEHIANKLIENQETLVQFLMQEAHKIHANRLSVPIYKELIAKKERLPQIKSLFPFLLDSATLVAESGARAREMVAFGDALGLYEALVRQGHEPSFSPALQTLENNRAPEGTSYAQSGFIAVCKALLEQQYHRAKDTALRIARLYIVEREQNVRDEAASLVVTLIKMGHVATCEYAIDLVRNYMQLARADRAFAIMLIKALDEQHYAQIREVALQAAKNDITKRDRDDFDRAAEIFEFFIQLGHEPAYEALLQAAPTALASSNDYIYNKMHSLIDLLATKKYQPALDFIRQAAKTGISSEKWYIREGAYKWIVDLINMGDNSIVETILPELEAAFTNDNIGVRYRIFDIFKLFLVHSHEATFNAGLQTIQRGLAPTGPTDPDVLEDIIKLIDLLLKDDYERTFDLAVAAVLAGAANQNYNSSFQSIIDLFQTLIQMNGYNPAFEPIFNVAIRNIKSREWTARRVALGIIEVLITHNYQPAIDKAFQFAIHQITNSNRELDDAYAILKFLVQAGYKDAFEPILEYVKKNLTSEWWQIARDARDFAVALLEQKYEPAITAIRQFIQEGNGLYYEEITSKLGALLDKIDGAKQ